MHPLHSQSSKGRPGAREGLASSQSLWEQDCPQVSKERKMWVLVCFHLGFSLGEQQYEHAEMGSERTQMGLLLSSDSQGCTLHKLLRGQGLRLYACHQGHGVKSTQCATSSHDLGASGARIQAGVSEGERRCRGQPQVEPCHMLMLWGPPPAETWTSHTPYFPLEPGATTAPFFRAPWGKLEARVGSMKSGDPRHTGLLPVPLWCY